MVVDRARFTVIDELLLIRNKQFDLVGLSTIFDNGELPLGVASGHLHQHCPIGRLQCT